MTAISAQQRDAHLQQRLSEAFAVMVAQHHSATVTAMTDRKYRFAFRNAVRMFLQTTRGLLVGK